MTDLISSVIVAGTRTPMGRLLGSLKDLSGSDLGAIAIRGALAKACVGPELVQYVIMGQVLTGGCRSDPGATGRGGGRDSHGGARADDQQGVPVGDRCDRGGGSVDPGR
jgi:hypothetical protein